MTPEGWHDDLTEADFDRMSQDDSEPERCEPTEHDWHIFTCCYRCGSLRTL